MMHLKGSPSQARKLTDDTAISSKDEFQIKKTVLMLSLKYQVLLQITKGVLFPLKEACIQKEIEGIPAKEVVMTLSGDSYLSISV